MAPWGLSGEDEKAWQAFVTDFRENALSKIMESAFVISIAAEDFDVKLAVETGAAVLLDKPIVVLQVPGREVPPGLRRVAHAVIEMDADIDTEAGQKHIARRVTEILAELGLA
ncbi:MAG TPA: hypothetical protein VGR26_14925 [Acidimicrobiales bacterium]|nr:hypothetical protein [Acidimicrobiales bacterium]